MLAKTALHIYQVLKSKIFHDRYRNHRTVSAAAVNNVGFILIQLEKISGKLRQRNKYSALSNDLCSIHHVS